MITRSVSPRLRRLRRRTSYHPAAQGWVLEQLESRTLLSTFAVSRADDALDFLNRPQPGTLRYAIQQANANSGLDRIVFNFAGETTIDISGNEIPVFTRSLAIDDRVILDGTTVGGYTGDPLVHLRFHTHGEPSIGVFLTAALGVGAQGSTIQGLSIDSVDDPSMGGILVYGPDVTISDCAISNTGGPGIEVHGANATISHCTITNTRIGVDIGTEASRTTVTGCELVGNGIGLRVGGDDSMIGGTDPTAGNHITSNGQGIDISGDRCTIEGNDIESNSVNGIDINGSDNQIGGADLGAQNRITGNGYGDLNLYGGFGVRVGPFTSGNVIQGNLIRENGRTDFFSTGGIQIISSGNLIGGALPGQGNEISGNAGQGIMVGSGLYYPLTASNNRIQGNLIGLAGPGQASGNNFNGILLDVGATNNLIGGTTARTANFIAYNGGYGVQDVGGDLGNSILGNPIWNNDFGAIANSSTVQGLEPTQAQSTGSAVIIQGVLTGLPQAEYRVELFANPRRFAEGRAYLGSVTVFTSGAGDTEFHATVALPSGLGDWITATATGPDGGTSGFSRPIQVGTSSKPDLAVASLAWNTTQGGVDFGYTISGSDLTKATTAALYWSDGTKTLGQPIYVETIPAGAQAKEYGPVHVPGSKLKDAPQGTTHLVLVVDPPSPGKPNGEIDEGAKENNNEKLLQDVRLDPQAGIDLAVLSEKTIGAIKDSLRYAGQSVGSISSTKRNTRSQAAAVYENIKKKGLPSQRKLYGNNEAMTAALDAYEAALNKYNDDVKKDQTTPVPDYVGIMTAVLDDYIKKNPGKVSAHLGDFSILQAVDISFTVQCPNPKLLWEGIVKNPKFSKHLAPPPYGTSSGEAAFHVEVPQ